MTPEPKNIFTELLFYSFYGTAGKTGNGISQRGLSLALCSGWQSLIRFFLGTGSEHMPLLGFVLSLVFLVR